MSVNLVRSRITKLESYYKLPLVSRTIDGVKLTAEGQQIFISAEKMEEAAFAIRRASSRAKPEISGEVKLAITEGLGTFWVAPRLIEFQRAYPQLLVDLKCEMRSADVLRLEADVAIQLERPHSPDLKVVKIGTLHSMPFVSQSYIDIFGKPEGMEDIRNNHRICLQVAEQTQSQNLYDKYAPGRNQVGFVTMRNNVSSAHIWAVAKGAGVGWLPTYVPAIVGNLIALDGERFRFDIWLTYHPDSKLAARVERMIDWAIECFDGRRFPWFRDQFVHPNDLPTEYRGEPLTNMFFGFTQPMNKAAAG